MNKKLLSIIFLFVITVPVNAKEMCFNALVYEKYEEATLNFLDGTSIKGYGKIKEFLGVYTIKFKATKDSKSDIWTELMVRGITFHISPADVDFEYLKTSLKSKPQLLEVLEKGVVSLYVKVKSYWMNRFPGENNPMHNYKATDYTYYVIRENEEKATNLRWWRFKKKIKDYFKDCESLLDKINSGDFNYNKINKIVYYYNDFCVD